MIKNYVLDTNVLIHDPKAIFNFEDNNVIIPFPVLEEIDNLKTRGERTGAAAREINRVLDNLRKQGNLRTGIKLENGGILRIMTLEENGVKIPHYLGKKMDDWILLYALELKKESKIPTYLVTKDLNLRIKAEAAGIEPQDYLTDRVEYENYFPGFIELTVDKKLVEKEKINFNLLDLESKPFPNTYFDLNDGNYYRYSEKEKSLIKLEVSYFTEVFGITPLNREQIFAFDALLNDEIPLVTLVGSAGTGKTLLALAVGLNKVLEEKQYKKLLVSKPIVPVGKDIGYLPGSIQEKMKPWLQPIYDNLDFLFQGKGKKPGEYLEKRDILEIEVLSYIRGRSIPQQYMIIDEAQNLTPHEIKTIITRVGENTKIVLTGDPFQIDNPYLGFSSNGLIYVSSKFKDSNLAAHIYLLKGERSELATKAAELL
ncbi:PhoH-like ATPase [Marinitoga hydrogenitolerans DSM 16785]|uniref:PhoH-like ATPase n=1 Tax=Marinitoga hydrogenitolerans (strain DSM 16785 / JCM 12826 / AT1271) TaxID=1122195 RepID=A0A1M4XMR5_MARH1|nr:PhoH family protein [Marinitoga hydrogenitolerans]SHE94711.1 PhoH-like ATPase [Marinitoga hydrogenitolerans DSM 16785]